MKGYVIAAKTTDRKEYAAFLHVWGKDWTFISNRHRNLLEKSNASSENQVRFVMFCLYLQHFQRGMGMPDFFLWGMTYVISVLGSRSRQGHCSHVTVIFEVWVVLLTLGPPRLTAAVPIIAYTSWLITESTHI